MAQVIKNMNDLIKILEARIKTALEMTQDEIMKVVQNHIDDYYTEYNPSRYIRTFEFQLHSLIKTNVVNNGGRLSCTVEIDPEYLHYTYPGNYMTGLGVAELANNHSHGGIYDPDFSCFWNDAMQELGLAPGVLYIMKKNLRKCGVPVK